MSRLLLDTNVVLWLLLGERERVSPTAEGAIEDDTNELLVSAVSVWEIAIKRSRGRLTIDDRWADALRRLDLVPLPVTALHATSVETLPWHHRDPFDRLLVAQALVESVAIVSADGALGAYDVDVVW